MPYELRVSGLAPALFDTEPEAVKAAAAALRHDPDVAIELIDVTTGQPVSPGASSEWREELKNRIGF